MYIICSRNFIKDCFQTISVDRVIDVEGCSHRPIDNHWWYDRRLRTYDPGLVGRNHVN